MQGRSTPFSLLWENVPAHKGQCLYGINLLAYCYVWIPRRSHLVNCLAQRDGLHCFLQQEAKSSILPLTVSALVYPIITSASGEWSLRPDIENDHLWLVLCHHWRRVLLESLNKLYLPGSLGALRAWIQKGNPEAHAIMQALLRKGHLETLTGKKKKKCLEIHSCVFLRCLPSPNHLHSF